MPTTAPTARKQYGLRWLFAVTALVGVLLGINRYYIGTAFTVKHKLHLIRTEIKDGIGMTKAEVEHILGKPRESLHHANMTADTYPGGFTNPYFVLYHDETGRAVTIQHDWTLDP